MIRLSIWLRREWLSLILAGAAVGVALTCVSGQRGLQDLLVLRGHRALLEEQRARLTLDNQALRTTVQKLKYDDLYLQRLIRSELGYARRGELVYRFSTEEASQPH